jgi:hypothetical protein
MEYVTALYRAFSNLKISDGAALGDWPPFDKNVVSRVQSGNLSSSLPNEAMVPDLTHQSYVVARGRDRFGQHFRERELVRFTHKIVLLLRALWTLNTCYRHENSTKPTKHTTRLLFPHNSNNNTMSYIKSS